MIDQFQSQILVSMKKIIAGMLLLCSSFIALSKENPAYVIYSAKGGEADYDKMVGALVGPNPTDSNGSTLPGIRNFIITSLFND